MSESHCRVYVRCKPSHERPLWKADKEHLTNIEEQSSQFAFTGVLSEGTSHNEIYEKTLAPRIHSLVHSNVSVLSYGSSSSGKSHTVFGTAGQTRVKNEARGMLYRCGEQLLGSLQDNEALAISFIQVFSDGRVADLFDSRKRSMEMLEESWPPTATQQRVVSCQELLRIIEKGYLIRNATGCVKEPQRKVGMSSIKPLPLQQYRPHASHALFRYIVHRQCGAEHAAVSTVTLVDLAGASIDHPSTDPGLDALNTLLHTLPSGHVINEPNTSLAKLLIPLLGGHCDTVLIANVSLASANIEHCLKLLSPVTQVKYTAKKMLLPLSKSDLLNTLNEPLAVRTVPTPSLFAVKNTRPTLAPLHTLPPVRSPPRPSLNTAPASPLFAAAVRAPDKPTSHSSTDSLSIESDSSSENSDPPTPLPTGPPPPPLRGIPHFNPDSPLSSQLTVTPLIPSVTSRPSSGSIRKPLFTQQSTPSQPSHTQSTPPHSTPPQSSHVPSTPPHSTPPQPSHLPSIPLHYTPPQPSHRRPPRLPAMTPQSHLPSISDNAATPSQLSSHPPTPQQQAKPLPQKQVTPPALRRSEGSLADVSSSSLSLSSSNESETRDTFNEDMQTRALAINTRGYFDRVQVPPITPIAEPVTPLEEPPSYPGHTMAPTMTMDPWQRGGEGTSGGIIHTAALEGVKSGEMKRLAIQYGVDSRDQGGRTPLMYAVLGNQPKVCEQLIKLRANIDIKDLSGQTPLLWATFLARAELVRVLLKGGADPSLTDSNGRTAFHWAMRTPNLHPLKWLCKYSNKQSLIDQTDEEGLTPLHWAVMADLSAHIIHLLTTTRADVSIRDRESRPPLTYAVLNFSPACIRAILEAREDAVNLADHQGRTALHYACAEGSADCVRTLLSFKRCNLHCTDDNGTTPLHWAAAGNQPGLLQLLLRRGADRAQCDGSGRTALDHAQEKGHNECVRILQTYGLRRPSSSLSLASHISLPTHGGAPPTYDEQGHVMLQRPNRLQSFFLPRLPGDGRDDQVSRDYTPSTPSQHTHTLARLFCCCIHRNNTVAPTN